MAVPGAASVAEVAKKKRHRHNFCDDGGNASWAPSTFQFRTDAIFSDAARAIAPVPIFTDAGPRYGAASRGLR
jgi:hypothetical protein